MIWLNIDFCSGMLVLFKIHGKFNVVCTSGMITIFKKSRMRERERDFDAAYLTMVLTNNIE